MLEQKGYYYDYENGMIKNVIFNIDELIAQGFTREEAYKVQRHDELFNNRYDLTEEEEQEMYALIEELGF